MFSFLKKKNRRFKQKFNQFARMSEAGNQRLPLRWEDRHPCMNDSTTNTDFDRHYVLHTAWAARVVALNRPEVHTDISSSLYFCTIVSAFTPVKFYDYRPAVLRLDNLETTSADLMLLPFADNSIASLSCMHVVEHVGLGRYGDPLDVDGDLKAIAELKRVVIPGGDLLFVVPIGIPRIMFNAHRIYSHDQIIEYFADFDLKEFALIPDFEKDGCLIRHAPKELADRQKYGCGCFWFSKKIHQ